MPDPAPDSSGGQEAGTRGDGFSPESRSDFRLLRRAAREGWNVPGHVKFNAVKRMAEYVDPMHQVEIMPGRFVDVPPAVAISAARALALFDTIDQRDRALDIREAQVMRDVDQVAEKAAEDADSLRGIFDRLERIDEAARRGRPDAAGAGEGVRGESPGPAGLSGP